VPPTHCFGKCRFVFADHVQGESAVEQSVDVLSGSGRNGSREHERNRVVRIAHWYSAVDSKLIRPDFSGGHRLILRPFDDPGLAARQNIWAAPKV
jgi:hypothetical protein